MTHPYLGAGHDLDVVVWALPALELAHHGLDRLEAERRRESQLDLAVDPELDLAEVRVPPRLVCEERARPTARAGMCVVVVV